MQAALPRWRGLLACELALPVRSEPFSAPDWIYELKYDGFRLLAAKDGDAVTLSYRSGRVATASFREVAAAIGALPARSALLDGELVAFAQDGRPDFERLRARASGRSVEGGGWPVTACLFDLLALDGHDLRQLPVVERKGILQELVEGAGAELIYVDHVEQRGEDLLAGARQLRLEGVVAKRADSRYAAGRTGVWRKFKVEETSDFIVIGLARPSRETFWRPALVLGSAEGDRVRYVGQVAVGAAELAALEPVLARLQRPSPPCRPAGRAHVWLAPAIVCEVRFLASSQRGLRHPVFVRFRPDKPWSECAGG